uniref:Uncharacterized protein n=1 Tax=Terrapene triunguis TaxID=2587831 RepID=A0A674IYZ4_9SAUR
DSSSGDAPKQSCQAHARMGLVLGVTPCIVSPLAGNSWKAAIFCLRSSTLRCIVPSLLFFFVFLSVSVFFLLLICTYGQLCILVHTPLSASCAIRASHD